MVVKVGGSLLATPGGIAAVGVWLEESAAPGVRRLLVAGGGPVVDGLRRVDQANPLPAEQSHWAAIRLMDANTRLLAAWLPVLQTFDWPIQPGDGVGDAAVGVVAWLRADEPRQPGERLRIGWETTSDAIAARLASVCCAGLVILKFGCTTRYDSLAAAAAAGVVDGQTPRVAGGLRRIEILSLKARPPHESQAGQGASTFCVFSQGKA